MGKRIKREPIDSVCDINGDKLVIGDYTWVDDRGRRALKIKKFYPQPDKKRRLLRGLLAQEISKIIKKGEWLLKIK